MEKAKQYLEELSKDESGAVSRIIVRPHRAKIQRSFYGTFAMAGIDVDRVEPGLISCTFKVPPRLTDHTGNFANGAIFNLVDVVSNSLTFDPKHPSEAAVSLNMSVSFLSTAKVDDELEVTARLTGTREAVSYASVMIRNKATSEVIAEGHHSLFSKYSKL